MTRTAPPHEPVLRRDLNRSGRDRPNLDRPGLRTLRRVFSPGRLPAVCVAVLAVAVLTRYGVSLRDTAAFGAYLLLGLAGPGMLLVRAWYGGRRTRAEEAALGLVLGYALEVPAYAAATALGRPSLALAWPIATYAVFLLVPGLRRHWRGARARVRAPLWHAWLLAAVVGYQVVWSAVGFFRDNALSWPALAGSYVDMPYHLALIGELRHHMPPANPLVAGEPLLYHWFVYAHMAAASRATGVEPLVVLFRLGVLPMMAAFTVLVAMAARRLASSWAAGALAAAGAVLMAAPNLYLGTDVSVFTWRGALSWVSPTQTFGALLSVAVVVVLAGVLGGRARGGEWALLGVLTAALAGAKSTYLPLLAAGLAGVVAVETLRHRRPPRRALAALALTGACILYAQFVLFGGARQGMYVDPLAAFRRMWGGLTGHGSEAAPPFAAAFGITLLYALSWAVVWCGILGLAGRPRSLLRPGVVLPLVTGLAGLCAVPVFGHPHLAQFYFFDASYPFLAIVAAYGLVVAVRRARMPPRAARFATACAAAAGAAAPVLVRAACAVRVPLPPGRGDAVLYLPYLALVLAVAAASAVLFAVVRRRAAAAALTLCLAAGAGLPGAWLTRLVSTGTFVAWTSTDSATGASGPLVPTGVPRGAMAAGRWLRDHSDPDDLVATNAHCLSAAPCDSRHFWTSAFSERRVLVEGWAYTATTMSVWRRGGPLPQYLPFWDGERLQLNDAAFASPSGSSVRRLRDRYGVRWLVADDRTASPRIAEFATLEFHAGDCSVYRVPSPSADR